MADISIGSLILVAFFTGLGSGIGIPLGNFLYEKYLKNKIEKTHDIIEDVKKGKIPFKAPNNDKIMEMLGKK